MKFGGERGQKYVKFGGNKHVKFGGQTYTFFTDTKTYIAFSNLLILKIFQNEKNWFLKNYAGRRRRRFWG